MPVSSSYITAPSEYRSGVVRELEALHLLGRHVATGEPAMPSMREISESATSAMPKSMMRTSESCVSMMFDGLMSRWITPRVCA